MVAKPIGEDNPHPPLISQLVFGEMVGVVGDDKETMWVEVMGDDGYKGFVLRQFLTDHDMWLRGDEYILARHMITIYHDADIKSAPLQLLFYPARVRVVGKKNNFFELASGGYVLSSHLVPIATKQDPIAIAKMMLGAVYLWGGRSFGGVDCSGLVQICYKASGINLPRDSHLQLDVLKHIIKAEDRQMGDLVFWSGHVAIVLDDDNVIHATAHDMMVVIEHYGELQKRLSQPASAGGVEFYGLRRVD